jgi:hypothetical protein
MVIFQFRSQLFNNTVQNDPNIRRAQTSEVGNLAIVQSCAILEGNYFTFARRQL